MFRLSDTVKVLVISNILFYVGTVLTGSNANYFLSLWFFENENFKIWQTVTHMFMHADEMHLLFNMIWLVICGTMVEGAIGKSKFIFLYLSAGVGAMGLQFLFQYLNFVPGMNAISEIGYTATELKSFFETGSYKVSTLELVNEETLYDTFKAYNSRMIGASGAVSGIIAAFGILYPNRKLLLFPIPIPVKVKYLVLTYFAIDMYSAITGSETFGPTNVAYWAHVGGAIVGGIMVWYWKKNSFNNTRLY